MRKSWMIWLYSAALGAIFGILYRLLFGLKTESGKAGAILTISYLAVAPAAMGWFAVWQYLRRTPDENIRWYKWLFLPWASVGITMLAVLGFMLEGAICVAMAAPILLLFSMIGGLVARIIYGSINVRPATQFGIGAIPFLALAVEIIFPNPWQVRTVNTEILIHAPAAVVWRNIERVRPIDPRELPSSWVNRIGFPLPVEATLSHEGIGGVRHASFTGGLVFTETIDEWEPEHDLRFSIRANTDSIPTSTLDEHVTIGGPYFDVLEGEYRLEPQPNGVLLHLTSHERLSTHLNPYAGAWTDSVMRSIQEQILHVVQMRSEAESAEVGTQR